MPRYPIATYRVQLNKEFPFAKAQALIPFLAAMGVSDLYASPVFCARPGSMHGYDVIDPSRANPELGGDAGFDALAAGLRAHGMGLLLDIVPNHMAATSHNAWWMDVLESGLTSQYAGYFDIEWDPAWEHGEEKIFLPVLGSPYGAVLENGEIQLSLGETGFSLHYYETKLPVDPGTYPSILLYGEGVAPPGGAFTEWMESLGRLPERTTRVWEGIEARRGEIPSIKSRLWSMYQECLPIREFIDGAIARLNGVKGDPSSFEPLDDLISRQGYRLAWWQVARERMNYRRFFDVSELIGIQVQNPEVFAATHSAILRWVDEGKATGLRVDHVDGLFKPKEYLERLSRIAKRPYIVVEKILLGDEPLPEDWPIEGASGYDFLGMVNGVFIDGANLGKLQDTYSRFTGLSWTVEDAAYEQKRWIIQHLFRGEMFALSLHLETIAEMDRHGRDLSPEELRRGLTEVTACLPVYRTYLTVDGVSGERDRQHVAAAIAEASRRNLEITEPAYRFLGRVLTCAFPPALSEENRRKWVRFVMRWQQLTGPITAKGVEDTAMYVYNRLVSMNEVGGQHNDVPLERFHAFNRERRRRWPAAMNTISTHDTKRSADVRARLNVLSEIPDEWNRVLFRWGRWNRDRKTVIDGRAIPDSNEETLIYQTLLGAWPLNVPEMPGFLDRVKQYLTKAAREAKVYTSWLKPDEHHEQALHRFAEALLDPGEDNRFLPHFLQFQRRLAFFGALNSLAQTLLMMTAPGIPDFYQNTIWWDLSLVDPDNRRAIGLDSRLEIADEIAAWASEGPAELLKNWTDGRVKAFLVYRGLQCRRARPDLFIEGDYVELETTGAYADNVIAFARRRGDDACIVVAPRWTTRLVKADRFPVGPRVWKDTAIVVPEGLGGPWRNAMTGEEVNGGSIGELLATFPVAALTRSGG